MGIDRTMSNVYKPKIVFSGPIGYMSGYGEHSRYIFKYLLKHQDKYDLFLVPQQWANSTFNMKKLFSKDELNEINHLLEKTKKYADKMKTRSALKFDLSLQVGVPTDWDFEVAEKTVGITAGIETDFMRFDWLGHFIYKCEEVWVVSKHSKYAALQTVDVFAKNQAAIYGNVGEMPAEASGTKEQSQKNTYLMCFFSCCYLCLRWSPICILRRQIYLKLFLVQRLILVFQVDLVLIKLLLF